MLDVSQEVPAFGTQPAADAQPSTHTPARRLIAAGVKRGSGPLVVEQHQYPPLPTEPAARRRAIQQRGW